MKRLFTEKDIADLAAKGIKTVTLSKNDLITPSAIDKVKELGFKIVYGEAPESIDTIYRKRVQSKSEVAKVIAIGSDHTGFKMKSIISEMLISKGYSMVDVGTFDEKSCDYPDFAAAVAEKVKNMEAGFGILVDATGIPSAITANKVPGILAATCYNEFTAASAREHNNANVLVIGAKALGEESIKSIVNTFFNKKFLAGRHQRRLDKIFTLEEKYKKK